MFVKLFARAGAKLPVAETFSGIQALLIYNAQSFLSENASDRVVGDLFLTTIAKVRLSLQVMEISAESDSISQLARRSGVFDTDAEWTRPGVNLTDNVEHDWRRWVRLESYRRYVTEISIIT